jgi:hypothetical protein
MAYWGGYFIDGIGHGLYWLGVFMPTALVALGLIKPVVWLVKAPNRTWRVDPRGGSR